MIKQSLILIAAAVLSAALLAPSRAMAAAPAAHRGDANVIKEAKFKTYDSRYYEIHTDAPIELVREAAARMTSIAEEYRVRTSMFGPPPGPKLPFDLFTLDDDYSKATGMPTSGGVFNGTALMARASDTYIKTGYLWHTVQHEAFHQFVYYVLGKNMPTWANEGMAEYFGEALWTGDGLVVGLIPPLRLKAIQKGIKDSNDFIPLESLLTMSHEAWIAQLTHANYDQAWSTIHFLVHADDGKYQKMLVDFLRDISKGVAPDQAMVARFGKNIKPFQDRYNEWWLAQEPGATDDLRCQAMVATLTSYLARATYLHKKFTSAEDFFAAAQDGNSIQVDGAKAFNLWLPNSLLEECLAQAPKAGKWSLVTDGKLALVLTRGDETYTGTFELKGTEHPVVKVVSKKPPTPKPADTPAKKP